jgi:protein-tyrosine-phosphatase
MKILFVCKYNRFRSRVAEAAFKKLNKNKKITAESAGLIKGHYPLSELQVRLARKFGLNINGKPKGVSAEKLDNADKIIIVADDVPKIIFNYPSYIKKVEVWNVKDEWFGNIKNNESTIKEIIKRVESLVKLLENEK